MVFNATVNNISAISWWPCLLMEETRIPGETHRAAKRYRQTSSHNVVSSSSGLSRVRIHVNGDRH